MRSYYCLTALSLFALILSIFALGLAQDAAPPDPSRRPETLPALPAVLDDATRGHLRDALTAMGMNEADLGFEKKPLDDPFRLTLVNRVLDEPLAAYTETEAINRDLRGAAFNRHYDQILTRLAQLTDLDAPAPVAGFQEELSLALAVVASDTSVQEQWFPIEQQDGIDEGFKRGMAVLFSGQQAAAEALRRAFAELTEDEIGLLRVDAQLHLMEDGAEEFGFDRPEDSPIEAFLEAALKVDRQALAEAGHTWLTATRRAADLFAAIENAPLTHARLAAMMGLDDTDPATPEIEFPGTVVIPSPFGDVLVCSPAGSIIPDHRAFAIVDLGGDDVYRGPVARAVGPGGVTNEVPVAAHIDLGGHDVYQTDANLACGGGLLGVGVSLDLGGDDTRRTGSLSCGAGAFGTGILIDEAGRDLYQSDCTAQGAGAFGWGMLVDQDGDDRYDVNRYGQGFAYTYAAGALVDMAGDDAYTAGGEYLHYPLFNDRFQALSQGFSIGIRPHASGGVGILVDETGNDSYTADIYGQGVGYWYAFGVLCDNGGNDNYTLGQYGQGSGIHLAAGALLDFGGNDFFTTTYGVGTGGCHDYAVGVLANIGGNDYYAGCGLTFGTGGTNGVGLFIERGGNDSYAATNPSYAIGGGRPARGYGSIGVLLELGGTDRYTDDLAQNDHISLKEQYGVVYDLGQWETPAAVEEVDPAYGEPDTPPQTQPQTPALEVPAATSLVWCLKPTVTARGAWLTLFGADHPIYEVYRQPDMAPPGPATPQQLEGFVLERLPVASFPIAPAALEAGIRQHVTPELLQELTEAGLAFDSTSAALRAFREMPEALAASILALGDTAYLTYTTTREESGWNHRAIQQLGDHLREHALRPDVEEGERPVFLSGQFGPDDLDTLYEQGCRWQVGDNRWVVAAAREALVAAGPEAIQYLMQHLNSDSTLEIRCLQDVFGKWGEMVAPTLMDLLGSTDESEEGISIRRNIIDLLGIIGHRPAVDLIVAQMSHERLTVVALGALQRLDAREVWPEVLPILEAEGTSRPLTAAATLAGWEITEAIEPMFALLEPPHLFTLRHSVARHIARFGTLAFAAARQRATDAERARETRMAAIWILGAIDDPRAVAPLSRLAWDDPDWAIRGATVDALAELAKAQPEAGMVAFNRHARDILARLVATDLSGEHVFVRSRVRAAAEALHLR